MMDLVAMKLLRHSDPRKQALAWLSEPIHYRQLLDYQRTEYGVIPATSVVPLTSSEPQINRTLRI
jgi:hypothetical protein